MKIDAEGPFNAQAFLDSAGIARKIVELDFTNFDFTVTDHDLPVRGALVTWNRLLGSLESNCVGGYATTDAHGRAVALALAPGRFRVTVVADGFCGTNDRHHARVRAPLADRSAP
jgi:hypothetical protein